nr:uncharacterized protein LOC106825343 isoform X2 [Equus asinus]
MRQTATRSQLRKPHKQVTQTVISSPTRSFWNTKDSADPSWLSSVMDGGNGADNPAKCQTTTPLLPTLTSPARGQRLNLREGEPECLHRKLLKDVLLTTRMGCRKQ